MRGHLFKAGASNEYFSITRGPLVLARDMRLGLPDTDEPLSPILTKDGFIDLQLVDDAAAKYWVRVKASFIAESHAEGGSKPIQVVLCDYASAGNTFDPASRFRVWMPQLVDAVKLP